MELGDGGVEACLDGRPRAMSLLDNLDRYAIELIKLAGWIVLTTRASRDSCPSRASSSAKRTGSSSLQGYQSDNTEVETEQRSDAIARAIYDAMCLDGINYIDPPASWDAVGQKIRTPEQVLDGKQGTCLDTAVIMAAAFEQAGLAPVVV